MHQTTIDIIIEYVWVPIVMSIVGVWHRLNGLGTRTALLEKSEQHYQEQRAQERLLRDKQREEILAKIDSHHKVVMTKLDALEARVKNGH